MPSIFISYASEQAAVAQSLEAELTAKGVNVWRDKTNLHAGDRWPKQLGEAIAGADAVVLLWSSEASQSDFVELEWNIAVAMQKPVMPCLLAEIDLPPTLKPSHRIPSKNIQQAAESIMTAIKNLPLSALIEQQDKLFEVLDAAPVVEPQKVLQHFHANFSLQNVNVKGNITNAGRDVIYNIYSREEMANAERKNSSAESRNGWKPIHTWVATGAALISIIVGGVQIQERMRAQPAPDASGFPSPTDAEEATLLQPVAGMITDSQDHPLRGVKVVLTSIEDSMLEVEKFTGENGRFHFQIQGRENQDIRIMATKDCFQPLTLSGYLGHTTMDASMQFEPKEGVSCLQE